MAAYSPISSRSHRTNFATTSIGTSHGAGPSTSAAAAAAPPYQIQLAAAACRRRDSINSSIGATSIRRLLTVNRGCRHKVPVHIRSKVAKNFTFLIIAHALVCAVLVPLFGLQVSTDASVVKIKFIDKPYICDAHKQGSNSTWYHKENWLQFGPNIGSLLLSICCLVTSVMCLLTTKIIKRIGYIALIAISYASLCLFLIAHLYPSIYTLLPGYVLLGATLGPAWISKWNLVVFFASRISCGQHECGNTNSSSADGVMVDDPKSMCSRDERIRRLARWFHAAENFGIVIGAILASVIMTCAANDVRCIYATNRPFSRELIRDSYTSGHRTAMPNATAAMTTGDDVTTAKPLEKNTSTIQQQQQQQEATATITKDFYSNYEASYVEPTTTTNQMDQLVDTMFNANEQGERICGADLCPVWIYYTEINYTSSSSFAMDSVATNSFPPTIATSNATINGTMPLVIVYTIFAIVALALSYLSHKIDSNFKYGTTNSGNVTEKCITDTLMFAGPLSYFIGTEQAYMLADFTKVSLWLYIGLMRAYVYMLNRVCIIWGGN